MPFSSFGIVASCGEFDDLRHVEVTASHGEVYNLTGRLFGKALPLVDLAHRNLPRRRQRRK
jgi:hypothetical protein